MKTNKVLDFMIRNKKWNKIINYSLFILASIALSGSILSAIDGSATYPAFRLLCSVLVFGLIVKMK